MRPTYLFTYISNVHNLFIVYITLIIAVLQLLLNYKTKFQISFRSLVTLCLFCVAAIVVVAVLRLSVSETGGKLNYSPQRSHVCM